MKERSRSGNQRCFRVALAGGTERQQRGLVHIRSSRVPNREQSSFPQVCPISTSAITARITPLSNLRATLQAKTRGSRQRARSQAQPQGSAGRWQADPGWRQLSRNPARVAPHPARSSWLLSGAKRTACRGCNQFYCTRSETIQNLRGPIVRLSTCCILPQPPGDKIRPAEAWVPRASVR